MIDKILYLNTLGIRQNFTTCVDFILHNDIIIYRIQQRWGIICMIDISLLFEQALMKQYILKQDRNPPKGIFKGFEWNQIPHKYCLLLDTLFLDYVNGNLTMAFTVKKNSSNQQKYRKIQLCSPLGTEIYKEIVI